jgi:multidrug efflux pump subunit AcrA (membrane-fusion protein)
VLDGLKPGESVILDNLVRLRPGTPVQVRKAG